MCNLKPVYANHHNSGMLLSVLLQPKQYHSNRRKGCELPHCKPIKGATQYHTVKPGGAGLEFSPKGSVHQNKYW